MAISFLSHAQPGEAYMMVDRNINDIDATAPKMSDGYIFSGYSYYVDANTDILGYEKMREKGIQELTILCDSIPLNLINNGQNIVSLSIGTTSFERLYNTQSLDSLKTFRDFNKLKQFPKLETVTISGYNIVTHLIPDASFSLNTLHVNTCNLASVTGALSVESMHLSGVRFVDIESLTSQVELKVLSINSCFGDSLRLDKTLIPQELIVRNNNDLIRFSAPRHNITHKVIVRSNARLSYFDFINERDSLSEVYFYGHPSALSGIMKTLESAKYIGEFECYSNGLSSEFAFLNDSLFVDDLVLNTGSVRDYVSLSIEKSRSIRVRNLTISGAFGQALDLSAFYGMEKVFLYTPTNVDQRNISKSLLSLKGLDHLLISGHGFSEIPSSFFVDNPNLKILEVNATKIQQIDFGGTILSELHSVYLRKNKLLEHSLDKTYLPKCILYVNYK